MRVDIKKIGFNGQLVIFFVEDETVLTDERQDAREDVARVREGGAEHFGAHISDEEAEVLSRALGRVRAAAGPS